MLLRSWVQLPLPQSPMLRKREFIKKEGIIIKLISKQDIQTLLDKGIITNTNRGYVNRNGHKIGYYKTCGGKRYIQDKYVDILKNGFKRKERDYKEWLR